MRTGRRKLVLAAAAVGAALAAFMVASAVSGTTPQQLVSNAIGGVHPAQSGTQPAACCGAEYPCFEGQATQASWYCCWCGCYAGSVKAGTSPQMIPCALEGSLPLCRYCPPPPCSGVCPMGPPAAAP